jgi:eukaryotic-like serine/threonine-protein kinase
MANPTSSSDRDPLERLAAEFLERRRRGEYPSPSEYAEQYPQWAEQILEFFPALELMEGLKPGSLDQTMSLPGTAAVATRLERLGDYRILREIGRGGMGVVYEAVQESLGRRVALKILPLHGRIDPVQMERFQLESRSAARLHHTGIVPVHGVGEHGGVHYYAMQYIQGHGLDVILEDLRRLRAGAASMPPSANGNPGKDDTGSMAVARSLLTGRFTGPRPDRAPGTLNATSADGEAGSSVSPSGPPAAAASISSVLSLSTDSGYYRAVARLGMQVAEALAHAHGLGVLHRDIKPSNLLLDVDGHVWVTDFGLAKLEGSDGPTQTGDIIGTLRYMAPERFEGWSDRRSDLYGLGMTLYELLTLRPAFESATRAKLIDQVIHDQPSSPRKHDPRVPRDLETIVMKAIAKEPSERYASAEALAADLENFVADKPIVARRSGLAERAWRWCRRNPAAAGLFAAVSVASLALVGIAFGLVFFTKLRTAYAEVESQRTIAEVALAGERRFLYYNRVTFAERELDDNNPFRAEPLLDECPPERRNWEWHYLKRQCHTDLLTFSAHESKIWSLAVSLDGRLIATGGEDKTVRLWDAKTGRHIHTILGHIDEVPSLSFSPDGTRIASAGGTIHRLDHVLVHDVASGRKLLTIAKPTGLVSSVDYTRDGGRLVVASGETETGGWVAVFDSRTGQEQLTIPVGLDPAYSASLSPDGNSLMAIVGTSNPGDLNNKPNEVWVWDATTKNVRFRLRGHTKPVLKARFSGDGRMIASVSYDATVRIWDAVSGRELRILRGHRVCVNLATFSPDDRFVASASDDGSAKIWDVESGAELTTLRGHRGVFNAIAFSPDGERVVSAGSDGAVKVWDALVDPACRTLAASDSPLLDTVFSHDGSTLATAGADGKIRLWDVRSGQPRGKLSGHNETVRQVAFSRDGKLIASAAGDWQNEKQLGEVNIWDVPSGRVIYPLRAHPAGARSVAFSPDGRWLASGGGEWRTPGQEVSIWDVTTGKKRNSFPNLKGGISQVVFSPDGRRIAAPCRDIIQAWDAETGENLVTMEGHIGIITGLAYNRDGRSLVSCSYDGTVRVWDAMGGRCTRTLFADKDQCTCVAVSPDGTRIASAGTDQTIKLWGPDIDQALFTLKGHRAVVSSVAFSPDGRLIASADAQGKVKIWDATPWTVPVPGEHPSSRLVESP